MKNTKYHKWYHKLFRIWCLIWGHNMFAGFEHDETGKHRWYDYCRRCEGIIGEPSWREGKRHPSLNIGFRFLMLRVRVIMLLKNQPRP